MRSGAVPPDPAYRRRLHDVIPRFAADAVLAFPDAAGLLVGHAEEFLGASTLAGVRTELRYGPTVTGGRGDGDDFDPGGLDTQGGGDDDALRDEFGLQFCWAVGERFARGKADVGGGGGAVTSSPSPRGCVDVDMDMDTDTDPDTDTAVGRGMRVSVYDDDCGGGGGAGWGGSETGAGAMAGRRRYLNIFQLVALRVVSPRTPVMLAWCAPP